ncbi:MAG: hypothetical protein CM15mV61_150 [uncultured marine virus]|nr:MAG: hypothetical protein CM15mV61_150 [uncultured marine virus]
MADYTTIDNRLNIFNTVLYTGKGFNKFYWSGISTDSWFKDRETTESHI